MVEATKGMALVTLVTVVGAAIETVCHLLLLWMAINMPPHLMRSAAYMEVKELIADGTVLPTEVIGVGVINLVLAEETHIMEAVILKCVRMRDLLASSVPDKVLSLKKISRPLILQINWTKPLFQQSKRVL